MKVVERKISDLIPAEYNPRYLSEDAEAHLKASLQRFGAVDPAIINTHKDRKDIIIGGHQRLKVWKSMGNDTFPCVEVELDRDKERELNIRLNKNTGAFDWDLLANYFEVEELTDWGFTDDELFGEEVFEEPEADDYEIPDEIETDFVLGDLIEIVEHRLLCGDSTDSDQVSKLMDGEKADMVFTDPPHDVEQEGLISFLDSFSAGVKFVLHNDLFLSKLAVNYNDRFERFFVHDFIFHIGSGNRFYSQNDLIACFDYSSDRFFGDKDGFSTVIRKMTERQKGTKNLEHSHQKPVYLVSEFVKHFSKENESVLDLYLGSGTTMVACHQLNRKCYGMELDPKYCQVIVDRMLKLDPTLEIKVNGKEYDKTVINQ